MTVTVEYGGRFGNHLFQYTCARLFAEQNGLQLETPLDGEGIVTTTPCNSGKRFVEPVILIEDNANDVLDKSFPPAKYHLRGFFQIGSWYHPRKESILKFLRPTRSNGSHKNTTDIVIHFRLTDYLSLKYSPHPDWYLEILKREKFDKLHIVSEEYHEKYFSYFEEFKPIIHLKDKVDDWYYLQKFDRIVCANGTFSWWAAFLSDASKIYTHKRWVKVWPMAQLSSFPNGIQVDGPFVDEKEL